MLSTDRALLMIADVQGKLAQLMHDRDSLFRNLQILIRGARILELPVVWMEQNPAGLGPTVPEIASLLEGVQPIAKMSFSGCNSPEVTEALRASRRNQIILAGIEAHICIYLTAADLLARGFHVEVIADAVSSRTFRNRELGLAKMTALRAGISGTETVLFELLARAEGPKFKEIVKLVK